MPHRKKISNLTYLTFDPNSRLIKHEALRVAKYAVTHFTLEQEVVHNRQMYLSDQVETTKQFVIGHIPPHLLEKFLANSVIPGICEALIEKKQEWTPTMTAMTKRKFGLEMHAIVKFCNLLVHPLRKVLDLAAVPQVIRTRLYGSLSKFKGIHTLILGSGSGGWVPQAYSDKFLTAIPYLKELQHFSLKYDCTESVLKVLSDNCSKTLRILDVERSQQVKQQNCVDYILCFRNLIDLNIFKTGLEIDEICQLLMRLKNLLHLARGDFLVEVLEYLDDRVNERRKDVKFKIQEFWASEEYFFHTDDQMLLVAKYCPEIQKALFMYRQECCADMTILTNFKFLKDLDLRGGRFYSDGISDFLQTSGHQLEALSIVHVEEIDKRAIALIASTCTNLAELGLHMCEFVEEIEPSADDPFRNADIILRLENEHEVKTLLRPMLDLDTIKIVGSCSGDYVAFLLSLCINVKHIFLGMDTGVSDQVWDKVLENNCLAKVETVSIQKCEKGMTIRGIELLLLHCENLKAIKNPIYFEGVHENEIKILKLRISEENWDLLLEDEKQNVVRDPSNVEFTRKIEERQEEYIKLLLSASN